MSGQTPITVCLIGTLCIRAPMLFFLFPASSLMNIFGEHNHCGPGKVYCHPGNYKNAEYQMPLYKAKPLQPLNLVPDLEEE